MLSQKADRPSRLFARAIILLVLLAVLAVQIDERCSRHADTWAREFGELPSVKVSDAD